MRILLRQPKVRALLRRLLTASLSAADPAAAVRRAVRCTGRILTVGAQRYDLQRYERVVAIGAGKASARMAAALAGILGAHLQDGLVVSPHGLHVPLRRIRLVTAGHPVPDRAGERAAGRLLALVRDLTERDLLLVMLSGGASSLLPAPAAGLTLSDKQRTTHLLLRSGATIQEMNVVRRHLSAIKGGRLAAATCATVANLILSDVVGDDLATIGSGPTVPDPSTFADARAILRRYGLWRTVPARVRMHLVRGHCGLLPETPKPGAPLFRRVQNEIIANNRTAVAAVAHSAHQAGLRSLVLTSSLIGEAREIARAFGALAREIRASHQPVRPPACLIAGGELTVSVRGAGRGGRAQEFALAAASEIAGLPRIWVAAWGTDGTDGPTDAAGAVVDGGTVSRANRAGLDPAEAMRQNDSYSFFNRLGGHIVTGPTGTNVNDLYLLLAL